MICTNAELKKKREKIVTITVSLAIFARRSDCLAAKSLSMTLSLFGVLFHAPSSAASLLSPLGFLSYFATHIRILRWFIITHHKFLVFSRLRLLRNRNIFPWTFCSAFVAIGKRANRAISLAERGNPKSLDNCHSRDCS